MYFTPRILDSTPWIPEFTPWIPDSKANKRSNSRSPPMGRKETIHLTLNLVSWVQLKKNQLGRRTLTMNN